MDRQRERERVRERKDSGRKGVQNLNLPNGISYSLGIFSSPGFGIKNIFTYMLNKYFSSYHHKFVVITS